jgi:hypothetical protein
MEWLSVMSCFIIIISLELAWCIREAQGTFIKATMILEGNLSPRLCLDCRKQVEWNGT